LHKRINDLLTSVRTISTSKLDIRMFFIVSLILSVFFIYYVNDSGRWYDVLNYFDQMNLLFAGEMPYRDFMFEYPPFSMVFMAIPRLFTSDSHIYCIIYSILTFIFFIIGMIYISKISKMYNLTKTNMMVFVAFTLIFANIFLLTRYDIFPTTMCIVALYYYLQKKYCISWLIISLAVMTKLFPIFIIPFLLIPFLLRKDWYGAVKGILTCAAVCVLVSLPFIIADPSTALDYLTYHLDRGLQVESVAASFIMVLNFFNPGMITVVHNYGSDNLAGALPDAIAPLLSYGFILTFILLLGWVIFKLYERRKSIDQELLQKMVMLAGVAAVMVFLALSKVFSAQFVVWAIMLLAFTQFSVFDHKLRFEILLLTLAYGILSAINGIFTCGDLEFLNNGSILIIFLRNITHIILIVWIIRLFIKSLKTADLTIKRDFSIITDENS
jgi:Predicted integral membrane protein